MEVLTRPPANEGPGHSLSVGGATPTRRLARRNEVKLSERNCLPLVLCDIGDDRCGPVHGRRQIESNRYSDQSPAKRRRRGLQLVCRGSPCAVVLY